MKTKKSLGQNFLRDEKILKKIADCAQIEKGDTVVEIGPGEGTLTKFLLEQAKRVIAVEKDRELVEFLENKFKLEIENFKLEIIHGDILEFPLKGAFKGNYRLVGNIPYYITGAVLKKFLGAENKPRSITFVVQREVAERIIAKNGKESILSISIKAFGEPEYGGTIKAGSFYPKPKVDSAILAVRNISIQRFNLSKIPQKRFFEIVKKGFSHKRKLLKSNLGVDGHLLHKCGIPEKARAENLSVDNWLCLTKSLL